MPYFHQVILQPRKIALGWALGAALLAVLPAAAEEFHLKDGTKLTGKIVGFEKNAFRVETSFGMAIIYKDRILRIVFVEAPAKKSLAEEQPKAKPKAGPKPRAKKPAPKPAKKEAARASPKKAPPPKAGPKPRARKTEPELAKKEKETVRASAKKTAPPKPPAPPTPPPPVKIEEHVTGTEYVNRTYHFRMFKPPTWRSYPQLVTPQNALVAALGTPDETTLLLVGRELYGGNLADYVRLAEKSVERLYQDYRVEGERPTMVAGLPAIERSFTGQAEGRFWTGWAVYFARGRQHFTLLGLTAAGDTTPFQKAVLHKVVASLQFLP
ncbi:MAG: hypothetical protein ACE5IP_06775 [Terriglobia bacterium]